MKYEIVNNTAPALYYTCENSRKNPDDVVIAAESSPSVRESIIDYIERSDINLSSLEPIDNPKLFKRIGIYKIASDADSDIRQLFDGELIKVLDRENIAYAKLDCTVLSNKTSRIKALNDINHIFNNNFIPFKDDESFNRNRKTCTMIGTVSFSNREIRDSLLDKFDVLLNNPPDGYEYQISNSSLDDEDIFRFDIKLSADVNLLKAVISKKVKFVDDFNDRILVESTSNKIIKNSLVLSVDNDGNVKISKKEQDLFEDHLKESNRMIRLYKKAKNIEGVKTELAKLYYMAKFIEKYHMKTISNPKQKKYQKELLDLRSTMINSFSSGLKWVTDNEPTFDFDKYFDASKYSASLNINMAGMAKLTRLLLTII